MANVTISSLSGVLKDTWKLGIPKKMYTLASPLFGMLSKTRDWAGATQVSSTKSLVYNYGLRSGLPARGGSTYGEAWGAPGNSSNDEVKVTPNRYYTSLQIDHDALDFGVAPAAYIEVKATESESHVQRTVNVLSKEFFGNGGGVIGKLNGVVGTPATGAVLNNAGNTVPLQLKNINDVYNFSDGGGTAGGGDKIQWASTNGLTGTVKPLVKTVIKADESAGTLTIDSDILAGDNILDNDYIFQNGRFGLAFKGLTAWCPTSSADLSSNFFNLDQTLSRRGGHRVTTQKGGDPYDKLLQMLEKAERSSSEIDCFAVTPQFMRALMSSSRYHQFVRIEGGKKYGNPLGEMYANMSTKERMVDATPAGKMRYGIDGIVIRWPAANRDVYVYSEKFLTQSEVAAEADDIVIGFLMADMDFALPKTNGWDWQNHVGSVYQQKEGEDVIASVYAVRGQICSLNPNNILVMGSNIVE